MNVDDFLKSEAENGRLNLTEEKTETTEQVAEVKTEMVEKKVEETPITEKVETTQVEKTEVKPEAEKTEVVETPKSVLDVLGSLNKVEEKTQVELPEDIKAKIALAEKYEKFANTDLAKLLETDLSLSDLISSIQVVDYSKMSAEQLIEAEAKMIAGDRFNQELLDAELDAYNLLTPKQKIEHEKNLIEKLGKSKTEINNELAKLIETHQSSKKTAQPTTPNFDEVAKVEKQKLSSTLSELTSKHGLDPKIAKGIEDLYSVQLAGAFVNERNEFNEVEFTKFGYKVVAYDIDMAKLKTEAAEQVIEAEKRGYEKAKQEFSNPDNHASAGGSDPKLSPDQIFNSLKFN